LQARDAAIECLRSTRPRLVEAFGKIEHQHKDDLSVVTELDNWAEEQYVTRLKRFDSGIGFLGEEHGAEGSVTTKWLIDPIDGTEYFIRGISGCVNMLTLVVDDRPKVCAIYDFVEDKMYSAVAGKGSILNGQKIAVSNRPIRRAFIDVEEQSGDLTITKKIKNSGAWYVRIPVKAGLLVACGMIEAYVVINGKGGVWDYAPRTLLVEEAGGVVVNVDSKDYDYRNKSFITSNRVIFEELRKIISDSRE